MSDPPPFRLLDPDAPTIPALRSLLEKLHQPEVSEANEEHRHRPVTDEGDPATDPTRRGG